MQKVKILKAYTWTSPTFLKFMTIYETHTVKRQSNDWHRYMQNICNT